MRWLARLWHIHQGENQWILKNVTPNIGEITKLRDKKCVNLITFLIATKICKKSDAMYQGTLWTEALWPALKWKIKESPLTGYLCAYKTQFSPGLSSQTRRNYSWFFNLICDTIMLTTKSIFFQNLADKLIDCLWIL